MNIVIPATKLNRLFRRTMDRYYQEFPIPGILSDSEMDDIDNIFAGCAFE